MAEEKITEAEIGRFNDLLVAHVQCATGARITPEASNAVGVMYGALVSSARLDHDSHTIASIREALVHLEAAEAKAADHG